MKRARSYRRSWLLFAAALPLLATPASHAGIRLETREIGRSVRDRALLARFTGDRSSARQILVVGCIHGDECAGKAVVRELIEMPTPQGFGLWLVYDINPDGSRANTRQNARGVDLNRNFPHDWQGGGHPWDRYYPGPRPASEPETRAARDLVLDVVPDITIWYHQPLSMVIRSTGDLDIQRRYARESGLPLRDYRRLHGTAVGWQNDRWPNKTAFVVELPSGRLGERAARRHARAVLSLVPLI